jgi:hypothetical protein
MPHFNPHGNKTSNGITIVAGLKVTDYDRQPGTVVTDHTGSREWGCCYGDTVDLVGAMTAEHSRDNDFANDTNIGCESPCRHDHWFEVAREDGSTKDFNGSRLEAR